MKIIYGTTNLKKKQQVEDFFKATGITNIELISSKDIGFFEEIIEDGKTFEENSLIKAKAIKKFCDKNKIEGIVVTDDTGLCVDCLNGEPGIYSARYVSKKEHPNDHQEASIKKLLDSYPLRIIFKLIILLFVAFKVIPKIIVNTNCINEILNFLKN